MTPFFLHLGKRFYKDNRDPPRYAFDRTADSMWNFAKRIPPMPREEQNERTSTALDFVADDSKQAEGISDNEA